jgi:hypothetical protein
MKKMTKEEREELEAVITESANKALGLEIAWRIVMKLAMDKFVQGDEEEAHLLRDVVAGEIHEQWLDDHNRHINALKELYPQMPVDASQKLRL